MELCTSVLDVHILIFNMNEFPVNEFSMLEGIAEKINAVALQPLSERMKTNLEKHSQGW